MSKEQATENTIIADEAILSDVIDKHPHIKDILIELSDYFKKLDDDEFMSTIANKITLKEAANQAKIYLKEVMYQINDSIGLGQAYLDIQKRILSHVKETSLKGSEADRKQDKPAWMSQSNSFIEKDVRNSHEDPFNMLNSLSEKLESGKGFKIIQRFEPTPLLQYMRAKGFDTFIEKKDSQEFHIYFYKK